MLDLHILVGIIYHFNRESVVSLMTLIITTHHHLLYDTLASIPRIKVVLQYTSPISRPEAHGEAAAVFSNLDKRYK